MRVVLDANVLASGVIGLPRTTSTPGEILRRWLADSFELVISDVILDETIRTLAKPYFRHRITPMDRQFAMEVLRRRANVVPITEQVHGIASHPEDDLVLSTAISAAVNIIVTGDKPLQAISQHTGIRILSPRDFLTLLDHDSNVV